MTTAVEAVEFAERKRADVGSSDTAKPKPAKGRRLNLNLPEITFHALQRLATKTGRSLTEMIRVGIALAQVAVDEQAHGRKLAVIDQEGKVIKEIIIPG